MKHLKQPYILLVLVTVIIGSRTLAQPIKANPTATYKPVAANIILQSKDGGQTWQDISQGLPENEQPEDFFAGESDLYLRAKNKMYHSKSNLAAPVWEKENFLPERSLIAFNRSGVTAYNYEEKIYQRSTATGTWLPTYKNVKEHSILNVFEASDGKVFMGCQDGLYRSADKGQSWKQVQNEGWVMNMVESEGVLLATGEKGIMRSTDMGEHWECVISEGGVGIAIERIDGGVAAIFYNTKMLTRRISISVDNGKTWKAIDHGLPSSASISSIKQMGKFLFCGHPDGIFRSSDMGQTWSLVYPGVGIPFPFRSSNNGKVFNIYVSGNVVYAVARDGGC